MTEPIAIDVWSDVACPWCYIGKRRLEAAVDAFEDGGAQPAVEVTYHSYLLMPDLPEEFDGSTADLLTRIRGIPAPQVREMHRQVAAIAAEVGLDYDFASQQPTNTRKAHEVLHLARDRGVQPEVKERLLRAHFVEGRHVGRDADLAQLGAEAGLDHDEVVGVLRDRTYADAVDVDIQEARRIGVTGVPFTVVEGRLAVSGAQPVATFLTALERAREDGAA